MRITLDLLQYLDGFINPLKQREISLRGYKIPAIENIGILKDAYDVIDFSQNSITCLENFPLMKRLSCIVAHNNKIRSFAADLGDYLVALDTLILTNNGLQHLSDLEPLSSFSRLARLVMTGNPVTKEKGYRLFVISKCPQLRQLDYKKVKPSERSEAEILYGKTATKEKKTFVAGGAAGDSAHTQPLSDEQKKLIQEAIAKASNMDEIDRLESILASGQIPRDMQHLLAKSDGKAMDTS